MAASDEVMADGALIVATTEIRGASCSGCASAVYAFSSRYRPEAPHRPDTFGDRFAAERAPLLISVDEAARLLVISQSLAYEFANRWIESDQGDGLPTIRLSRSLLVERGDGPGKRLAGRE